LSKTGDMGCLITLDGIFRVFFQDEVVERVGSYTREFFDQSFIKSKLGFELEYLYYINGTESLEKLYDINEAWLN